MKITICGGGNAAHAAAGLLGAQPGVEVSVYVPFAEEEEQWKAGLSRQGGIRVQLPDREVLGCPQQVSSDPARVIPGSDYILLALPAFAHDQILKDIAPYIKPGAVLGAMPARGGFDWSAKSSLRGKSSQITLFGLQTLPWACRIERYGESVRVMGTKEQVEIAARPAGNAGEIAAQLGNLLGLVLQPVDCFFCLTLANTGQLLHPGLMYGLFHSWQGEPLKQAPLFYQGVNEESAAVLEALSSEVMAVRAKIEQTHPCLDLAFVRPLKEWLKISYNGNIADPETLQSSLATNRSYAGLTAPVRETPSGLAPDFTSRYLSEDVPYGLVVTRGIAGLAGVPTPMTDRVIEWSQEKLGVEYLKDGELRGKDLRGTRAPQRYGIKSLEQLINFRQA
jgi:hypothetical protein